MMNIEALLERYYEGDTTLEEEALVREYLSRHPEAGAKADQELFQGIESLRTAPQAAPQPKPKTRRRTLVYWLAGGSSAVAAGIALFIMTHQTPVTPPVALQETIGNQLLADPSASGEIKDEQQALEQARRALAFVSSKLNKGTAGINQLNHLESSLSKIQN